MELPASLWAANVAPAIATPPLAGRQGADVTIVGDGFNGLLAALHLAEAGDSAGSGHAGRRDRQAPRPRSAPAGPDLVSIRQQARCATLETCAS